MQEENYWRKCGSCKTQIPYGGVYQRCSVSSCRKHVYCSVDCWNLHAQVMNHKSAFAEEEYAPSAPSPHGETRQKRRIIVSNKSSGQHSSSKNDVPREILVVASKLKQYVKAKHDLNTSANVMERLSDIMRVIVDETVENSRIEGRKTLMDRDFK